MFGRGIVDLEVGDKKKIIRLEKRDKGIEKNK